MNKRYSGFQLSILFSALLLGLLWLAFSVEWLPKFRLTGSLLESDYAVYWFRTPGATDPEEITFFGDFRSKQVTQSLFDSNASAGKLIEKTDRTDDRGKQSGQRGVVLLTSKEQSWVRIFWTEEDDFWCVQAPSLELATEFEKTDWPRKAKANKSWHAKPKY